MSKVKRRRNKRKRLNQQNEEIKQEFEQNAINETEETLVQKNEDAEENIVEKETADYNKKKYSYDFDVVRDFFKKIINGYKKNRQAWKKIFLFSLSLIIIVMTIGNVTNHIIGGKVTDSYSDYSKYSIKYDKMLDHSGTYYVYMYSESCSHCDDLKKYIFQYLDSDKNSSTGVKLFTFCVDDYLDELTSKSDNIIGVNDVHDLKVSSTPTMMLVVDGTVMNVWSTPSTIKNQLSY